MKIIGEYGQFFKELWEFFRLLWQWFDAYIDQDIMRALQEMSEQDIICALAIRRNCSELDLFMEATKAKKQFAHKVMVKREFDACCSQKRNFPQYVSEYLMREWQKEIEKRN